jgi:MFS family permease
MAIGYSATASVGHHLSPERAYILLPLIMQVFGACIIAIPASKLMMLIGRRNAFMIGSTIGIFGGLLCVYSLYIGNFWLLAFSTLFIGMSNGFGEFIKYAAADLFIDEKKKNKSISIIVSGGIVAAFLGPAIANFSNQYFDSIRPYIGPYIVVALLSGISVVLFYFYNNKVAVDQNSEESHAADNLPMTVTKSSILTSPVFILGTSMGVLAGLIMSVMMDAFPITMMDHGMYFSHTTTVLQWHLLAMFAPSYLTSIYISKFGVTATAFTGIFLNIIGITFALQGTEFYNFLVCLIMVGFGWNFMYLSGASLIANMKSNVRKHAEGFNNLFTTATNALAAPIAAFIVIQFGWEALSYVAFFLTATATLIVIWFRSLNSQPSAEL